MAKLTLTDIGTDSLQAVDKYNANNAAIEAALENTLSLDGTSPNSLQADLDLNDNQIINLATPTNNSDAATKAYVDTALSNVLIGLLPDAVDYVAADAELEASLITQITVVANATDALASVLTVLSATVDNNGDGIADVTALISSESSTRATADTALSNRLDVVEASVADPNTALVATVNSHTTAIADLDSQKAEATDVTTLTATVTTLSSDLDDLGAVVATTNATVTSEAAARASADSALSTRLDSVEASVGTPDSAIAARVTTLESATASLSSGKASASSVTSLTSTVNGHTSSINTNASTIATVSGKLNARYGIAVDGGGNGSFISLQDGVSTPSTIKLAADKITLNGNVIITGTLQTAQLASNAATKASSIYTSGIIYPNQNGETTIQTLPVTTSGGTVVINASAALTTSFIEGGSNYCNQAVTLKRGATTIYYANMVRNPGSIPYSFTLSDTPSAGTYSYTLTVTTASSGMLLNQAWARSLVATELKR